MHQTPRATRRRASVQSPIALTEARQRFNRTGAGGPAPRWPNAATTLALACDAPIYLNRSGVQRAVPPEQRRWIQRARGATPGRASRTPRSSAPCRARRSIGLAVAGDDSRRSRSGPRRAICSTSIRHARRCPRRRGFTGYTGRTFTLDDHARLRDVRRHARRARMSRHGQQLERARDPRPHEEMTPGSERRACACIGCPHGVRDQRSRADARGPVTGFLLTNLCSRPRSIGSMDSLSPWVHGFYGSVGP